MMPVPGARTRRLRDVSSAGSWSAAAEALAAGAAVAEACAVGGLGWPEARRLVERWADSWTELLDGLAGRRVLLIDDRPGRSLLRLADIADHVGSAESDGARTAFRRALAGAHGVAVTVGPLAEHLAEPGRWDVIVVGPMTVSTWPDFGVGPAYLARLEAGLADRGRLVIVTDNLLSPLRAFDRLGRTGAGTGGTIRLGGLDAMLARVGLRRRQVFGLLRSSLAPVTGFDLEAPRSTAAVLDAAAARQGGGPRLALTRALSATAARGGAAYLVPAWLVVASRTGDIWIDEPDRTTGMIGLAHSTEPAKILRGEPPRVVDKWYSSQKGADAEVSALEQLCSAGIDLAPPVIKVLGRRRTRIGWVAGRPINADRLSEDLVLTLVKQAAGLLGVIHRSTRNAGEVLVHGDYTLSNCLVDAGKITGVIDWSGAYRGDGHGDLELLVRHAARHSGRRLSEKLRSTAQAAYEAQSQP